MESDLGQTHVEQSLLSDNNMFATSNFIENKTLLPAKGTHAGSLCILKFKASSFYHDLARHLVRSAIMDKLWKLQIDF